MNGIAGATYISWLAQGHARGPATVASIGGKGANLVAMHRAGLNVPAGFCVTTDAYRRAVAPISDDLSERARQGDAPGARELISQQQMPAAVRDAIRESYQLLGSPMVAVRSSATTEDLDAASFAGQQDTVLGVHDEGSLVEAVIRCWLSLWTDRAVSYRDDSGFSHEHAELAVVVQLMVEAEVAGVLFTADPVSGDRNRVLVSASYGLGESVVAAKVTPDTFTMDTRGRVLERRIGEKETRIDLDAAGGTTTRPVPEDDRRRRCLSDQDLRRLVDLGKRVSSHYDAPQDIEWGLCCDELYLLQTRPITTIARRAAGHRPAKSRIVQIMRDDLIEHYPAPYPLDLMPVRKIQEQIQGVLESLGVDTPSVDSVIRIDDDGVASIHAAWPRLTHRLFTHMPRTVRRAIIESIPDWHADEDAWRRRLESFRDQASTLEDAHDNELIRLSHQAVGAAAELTRERFLKYLLPFMLRRIAANAMLKLARVGSSVTTEDLFADLDFVTSVVDHKISRLRDKAVELGLAEALSESDSPEHAFNSGPAGNQFAREVQRTLAEIGARTPRMYLPYSSRSWKESPDSFLALVAAGLRAGDTSEHVRADKRQLVRIRLPRLLRNRWDTTVAALRKLHVGREGSLYLIEEWFVQARRVMDEIARRLVERGALATSTDVIFATFDEVEAALYGKDAVDLKRKISRRRQMRGNAEASWWDRGESQPGETNIRGVAASPGRTSGLARVVRGPAEFSTLQAGEILVCQYTDPTWTPLFSLAAAVVADTGGPLSHAAIVAREYGVPAVLGTQVGTREIQTGQRLRVDGSAGTVELIEIEDGP